MDKKAFDEPIEPTFVQDMSLKGPKIITKKSILVQKRLK
jgi:hypothetical protein